MGWFTHHKAPWQAINGDLERKLEGIELQKQLLMEELIKKTVEHEKTVAHLNNMMKNLASVEIDLMSHIRQIREIMRLMDALPKEFKVHYKIE